VHIFSPALLLIRFMVDSAGLVLENADITLSNAEKKKLMQRTRSFEDGNVFKLKNIS